MLRSSSKTFTVMTINLRHGWADDGLNSWDIRKGLVVKIIHDLQPDFLGTQEGNDFQLEYLSKNLKNYECAGVCGGYEPRWEYLNIYHRKGLELLDWEYFYLSETPDIPSRSWGSIWPRGCFKGIFKWQDKELVIVNTHFDFQEPAQTNGAMVILNRLGGPDPERPVILLGDFNSTPEETSYFFLTGKKEINGQKGWFKDVFPSPQPFTYHRFTGNPLIGYIDWILYSGPLRVHDKKIVTVHQKGIYPSDHFPVMAEFSFKR